MKLYLVWTDNYSFDEYDAFVVLANSKEEAIDIACTPTDDWDMNAFTKQQRNKLEVKEINLNDGEPRQILGSFNAG